MKVVLHVDGSSQHHMLPSELLLFVFEPFPFFVGSQILILVLTGLNNIDI